MAQFPATIDLSGLNGGNGFKLSGVTAGDGSGFSVASAGDVNGDGFADLIVGAYRANASYIVFGKKAGFAANLDLLSLNGSNGFKLAGSGQPVASAGDVNADGYADLIVGASSPDASYVVFGKEAGFAPTLVLSNLNGSNGFTLSGSGVSVASVGDVNGDGFADLITGAPPADPNGTFSGASYVVFGKGSRFAANIDLSNLNGSNGFKLSGGAAGDLSGVSVASAGDVNGDGFADVIVGAPRADARGARSGASYVVFGKASGFSANLDLSLSSLNGSNGFKLSGVAENDFNGQSVASAGDVNGDGFADLIVGARSAGPHGSNSGASYVVFGKRSGFAANILLTSLNGSNGFKLSGAAAGDLSGWSVASAGDVNGDGFADLIVGSFIASASYVVFGKRSGFAANFDLSTLDGSNGFTLNSDDLSGSSVASAGDVNGDGFADLIVGAYRADPHGVRSGASYVVFGRAPDGAVVRIGTATSQTLAGGAFDDTLSGLDGDDKLFGNGGRDMLNGGAGDDELSGGAGNDELNGGTGADVMIGGDGDDTYIVNHAFDVAEETGDGYDKISTSVSVRLTASQAIDFLDGRGTANLTLAGNQLANSIWGSAGNDTVAGAGGADILRGYAGTDTLFGGKGNDTLEGGDGADRFRYRLGDGNDDFTDFSAAGGDRVALVNVTVSQLVNNIATMSDGSILTAQTGYMWVASDFMPG